MNFMIECEQEMAGRCIAAIPQLPGVLCYGRSRDDVVTKVEVFALRAISERREHGEYNPVAIHISLPVGA